MVLEEFIEVFAVNPKSWIFPSQKESYPLKGYLIEHCRFSLGRIAYQMVLLRRVPWLRPPFHDVKTKMAIHTVNGYKTKKRPALSSPAATIQIN